MVGIIIVSTRKYKQFVNPLVEQIEKLFLPGTERTIFNFTDEFFQLNTNLNIHQIIIPPYKFPHATLYRFKCIRENKSIFDECTHLFYIDADMAIIDVVLDDILVETGLVVVRHPGFYMNNGWGSTNNPLPSTSYLPESLRKHYVTGGFNGGTSFSFLSMCCTLADNIDMDDAIGVIAEHNDESHLNHYISMNTFWPVKELSPEFCMVEQIHLRKEWGIDNLKPVIIALNKNHNEIRS